jgi:hypothetical protein
LKYACDSRYPQIGSETASTFRRLSSYVAETFKMPQCGSHDMLIVRINVTALNDSSLELISSSYFGFEENKSSGIHFKSMADSSMSSLSSKAHYLTYPIEWKVAVLSQPVCALTNGYLDGIRKSGISNFKFGVLSQLRLLRNSASSLTTIEHCGGHRFKIAVYVDSSDSTSPTANENFKSVSVGSSRIITQEEISPISSNIIGIFFLSVISAESVKLEEDNDFRFLLDKFVSNACQESVSLDTAILETQQYVGISTIVIQDFIRSAHFKLCNLNSSIDDVITAVTPMICFFWRVFSYRREIFSKILNEDSKNHIHGAGLDNAEPTSKRLRQDIENWSDDEHGMEISNSVYKDSQRRFCLRILHIDDYQSVDSTTSVLCCLESLHIREINYDHVTVSNDVDAFMTISFEVSGSLSLENRIENKDQEKLNSMRHFVVRDVVAGGWVERIDQSALKTSDMIQKLVERIRRLLELSRLVGS